MVTTAAKRHHCHLLVIAHPACQHVHFHLFISLFIEHYTGNQGFLFTRQGKHKCFDIANFFFYQKFNPVPEFLHCYMTPTGETFLRQIFIWGWRYHKSRNFNFIAHNLVLYFYPTMWVTWLLNVWKQKCCVSWRSNSIKSQWFWYDHPHLYLLRI